jgi:MFS family permease
MSANSSRAWAIFMVGSAGFVLSMFYRVSPSIIAPHLTKDLGLDPAQLSDLTAAFFYAFAACQIPLGVVLDRVGIRWPMAGLSLVGAGGAAWFAAAGGHLDGIASRALLGLGMSCGLMGPLSLFARWFPPRLFATIAGLLVAVGALGQVLASTPLALLDQAVGWRGSYLIFAGINLVQALAVMVVVRDHPPGEAPPPPAAENPLKGLGRLLRMPAYWGISLGTFCRFGCLMAVQGLWAGPFIIYGLGYSSVEAGNALLFLSVGYMVALPLSGRLSDNWLATRKWVIAPSLLLFSAMLLSMVWWRPGLNLFWIYLVFTLLGASNAPGQIMYAHIKELVPRQYTSTAMTGINLFTMLGPAAFMQITGLIIKSEAGALAGPEPFQPAWLFMAAVMLGAGLVYVILPDSRAVGECYTPEGGARP